MQPHLKLPSHTLHRRLQPPCESSVLQTPTEKIQQMSLSSECLDFNMDAVDNSYIWQRRIALGIRYQKGAIPFPESVEIGLEFNAALERTEKLDQSLLTNAVMLELCEFAKTVTRSEKYFLFEMLHFNFDLGVDMDNDQQWYNYAIRVHNKIKQLKEQVRLKPKRWEEQFLLPDPNLVTASSSSEVAGRYSMKWTKIGVCSVLSDGSKNVQSSENKTADVNGVNGSSYVIKKRGGIQPTNKAYPFCAELGVTLVIQTTPKQKLDPNLITIGLMLELLDFSNILCGSHSQIVCELLKQNFNCEFSRSLFRMQLKKLMERKFRCLKPEEKDTLRKEVFQLSAMKKRKYTKRKKLEEPEGQTTTGKRSLNLRQRPGEASEIWQDASYMCPVEFDTENKKLEEVKQEEEEVFVSTQANGSCLFSVQEQKSNRTLLSETVKDNGSSQLNPQPARNSLPDLKPCRETIGSFQMCKEIGLDLDVSSKSKKKKKLDLQVLTRGVLLEVHRYVEQNCNQYVPTLYKILEHNFDLSSQSHRRVELAWSIASQVIAMAAKNGRNGDYLNKVFELPFEDYESLQVVCKEEPDNGFIEPDLDHDNDIMFVRKLKPVDIDVVIE